MSNTEQCTAQQETAQRGGYNSTATAAAEVE